MRLSALCPHLLGDQIPRMSDMGVSERLTAAAPSFPVWSVDAGSAQGILYEDSFLLHSARGEEVRGHPPPHTRLPA